jgi:hypothetical protein
LNERSEVKSRSAKGGQVIGILPPLLKKKDRLLAGFLF